MDKEYMKRNKLVIFREFWFLLNYTNIELEHYNEFIYYPKNNLETSISNGASNGIIFRHLERVSIL